MQSNEALSGGAGALELELPDFAFVGKAGAGKSTAASVLVNAGYMVQPIAGPLKDMAATIWGPEGRTDRGKLQKLGQHVRSLDEDAWVRLCLRKIESARTSGLGSRVVVDDVRFPNEWWMLKAAGFVIVRVDADYHRRVDRLRANGKLQDESQLLDSSEVALDGDDFQPDYVITNNGSWSDFAREVVSVLRRERRRV